MFLSFHRIMHKNSKNLDPPIRILLLTSLKSDIRFFNYPNCLQTQISINSSNILLPIILSNQKNLKTEHTRNFYSWKKKKDKSKQEIVKQSKIQCIYNIYSLDREII